MSLPSITYKCSRCDYSQCGAVAWGTKEYVLPNGLRLRAPSRLGWCHDCKDLEPIESISIEDRLKELRKIENDLAECPPPRKPRWWHLGRYIFYKGTLAWEKLQRDHHFSLVVGVADARDLLALQQQRINPPRCMECGSANVTAPFITNENSWEDSSQPKPTGFHHPDCGGEILMVDDDLRIGLAPSVRRYTPDGDFIEKVDLAGYTNPALGFYAERETSNASARRRAALGC
jgi:hypothetical protein